MPRMRASAIIAVLPHVVKRLVEEEAYRNYITDCLYYEKRDKMLTERFYDIIHKTAVADNRSGDEIAADVIGRMGLKYNESI